MEIVNFVGGIKYFRGGPIISNIFCSGGSKYFDILDQGEQKYGGPIFLRQINKVWGFLPKNPTYIITKYLLSDSMAALVRHSQAQNIF